MLCVYHADVALQEVQDSNSAELGLTLYQLATTYYAHDLLTDAGPTLQRATTLLRAHYPQDHDLVIHVNDRHSTINKTIVRHYPVIDFNSDSQTAANTLQWSGGLRGWCAAVSCCCSLFGGSMKILTLDCRARCLVGTDVPVLVDAARSTFTSTFSIPER
jgi:hypothetical protein